MIDNDVILVAPKLRVLRSASTVRNENDVVIRRIF
jgi:hypothetical protein